MITPTYTTVNTSPIKDTFEQESPDINEILIEEEFMAHQPVYPLKPEQANLKTRLFLKTIKGVMKRREVQCQTRAFF